MLQSFESELLAEKIFSEIHQSIVDLRVIFPSRNGKITTRFAPSPTGFLHIGGLYSSYVSEKFAHQHDGIFFLRIEDTDKKREKDDGIEDILQGLEKFSIHIDEGPENPGNYGPYVQSQRKELYAVFAKDLLKRNLAYPCFMTEQEIQEIRDAQSKIGIPNGIYGEYSLWAHASYEQILEKLEQNTPFVLRFRSHGDMKKRRVIHDEIRGDIETQDNYTDIVLLKIDGIPTYHFAHIVDDFLMGTTHVIRGDEWIPSLPLHIQLFESFGITPPKYAHIAPLMKTENGSKRKLSKRKDPEANVEYFFEQGYPIPCIKDYLLNILDSSYDTQRLEGKTTQESFVLDFANMPKSGALFDLKKLESLSHEYISNLSNDDFFTAILDWSEQYDTELFRYIEQHQEIAFQALTIQRLSERDPKKIRKWSDVRSYITPFLPELFQAERYDIHALAFEKNSIISIIQDFTILLESGIFEHETWLDTLKHHAYTHFSVARDNAEWKTGQYTLKFSDYIMILRFALTKSTVSPDLREMLRVLGNETVLARLQNFIKEI